MEAAAASFDGDSGTIALNLCTERCDASEAAGWIRTGRKVFQVRDAVGESAEQGIAMRDAFVAGQAKAAEQVMGRCDDTGRCG